MLGFPESKLSTIENELTNLKINYIIVTSIKNNKLIEYKFLKESNYNKYLSISSKEYILKCKINNIKEELLSRINDSNINKLLLEIIERIYHGE